jgi:ankyrin repeat protein
MFGWLSRAFTKVKNFIASILFRVLSFFGLFKTQPTLHELYRVVRNGDVQKSRAFLKTVSPKTLAEEELNYQGFNNMNSVSIAIAMGQVPMLKYLVEERNIPLQSCKKRPLEIAAEYGHVNVLKYLVERGEDLFEVERANEPYTNGLKSILEVAVINGHLGVVYPILVHLENTGFPVMVRDEVLANEVIKINATILKTVKELPVKSSDNAVPTELMVLNKSVEKRARFLHCVEHRMKMEFIKMFLENPDLITMTDIDDPSDTLAHFCAYSQQHMMDLVLDFGGDGCKYNSKGIRPIHFAVAMNNNDALKSLLKVGEDPNVRALNDDHYTPLLIAVTISTQTVQILLDHGADPCLAGVDGLEPIHVAAKIGHSHTVELLKIAGANINSVANGYTPLHYAIQENMLETVLCFLRLGADTKVLTPNKKTLVQYAESLNAHPNIIGVSVTFNILTCSYSPEK